MTFYNPKIILPETGEKVNLKLHDLYHYESGYIFDGKNFRRCVFEIGDIIPMNKVIEWSREDNIWHNSNEEQPDGDRVIVCYHTPTNMFGDVGKYSLLKPNYRWAYLEDLDPEYKKTSEYFYCKYGGCMPLCSDCERNHINSHLNTEDIKNWFVPQKGTKQCKDYLSHCTDCINDKGCIICENGNQKQILA